MPRPYYVKNGIPKARQLRWPFYDGQQDRKGAHSLWWLVLLPEQRRLEPGVELEGGTAFLLCHSRVWELGTKVEGSGQVKVAVEQDFK